METSEIVFESLKLLGAAAAAGFAYWQFFREGTHHQRIEFDIDLVDLGLVGDERVVEIGCIAENKGNVEQRFGEIRVKVRGLPAGGPLAELKEHPPRLEFPVSLARASLIPPDKSYYFVRPKVRQRFPLAIKVPGGVALLLVHSTFQYQGTEDIHSAERAFRLG